MLRDQSMHPGQVAVRKHVRPPALRLATSPWPLLQVLRQVLRLRVPAGPQQQEGACLTSGPSQA